MKIDMKKYKENGYLIFKSVFDIDTCGELKNYLNSLEVKRRIPFSEVPWGWGSLLKKGPYTKVTDNEVLNEFCSELFNSNNYVFPNMMVNNKAPWIGPDVEWHREIFNVSTYAPGYSEDDWENLFRVYIALDKQTKYNGCLQLYSKSHKIDHLDYEDIVDSNFGHKRRVTIDSLNLINDLCEHVYCEMNPGDMLVFNDRIVHGSNTNKGPEERKSVVLGVRHNIKNIDTEIYEKETYHRRNFIVNHLTKIMDKMKSKNMYSDFNKEEK